MSPFQQRLTTLKEEGFHIVIFDPQTEEILAEGMNPEVNRITFVAENKQGLRDVPIVKAGRNTIKVLFKTPTEFSQQFTTAIGDLFSNVARATKKERHYWQTVQVVAKTIPVEEWNSYPWRVRHEYLDWHQGENQVMRELRELQQTTFLIPADVLPEIEAVNEEFQRGKAERPTTPYQKLAPMPPQLPKRKRRSTKTQDAKAEEKSKQMRAEAHSILTALA